MWLYWIQSFGRLVEGLYYIVSFQLGNLQEGYVKVFNELLIEVQVWIMVEWCLQIIGIFCSCFNVVICCEVSDDYFGDVMLFEKEVEVCVLERICKMFSINVKYQVFQVNINLLV